MSKVRIINKKTGEIRFVSPYVAGQPHQLKQYGFEVEDLNFLQENKKIETPMPETVAPPVIDEEDNLFEMEEEQTSYPLTDEPVVAEKKKPGPKPKNKTVTE